MIAGVAGIRIAKKHIPGPQGVRGRNSDDTRVRNLIGWDPEISLEEGLARTYAWIEDQVRHKYFQGVAPLAVGTRYGHQEDL